jgi:ArsR family transcriptional regulator
MRESGLLATRRDAQTIHYRICDPAALRVIGTLAELFCPPEQGKSS